MNDTSGNHKIVHLMRISYLNRRFTKLIIMDGTRADIGQYRVVVENDSGSDSGTIALGVADHPDPPRFPIVENVLDEAAILSWKPPELDTDPLVTKFEFILNRY